MTVLNLIYKTLKQYKKPLTILGIWFQARKYGLTNQVIFEGNMPVKSLESQLRLDLKNNKNTPFVQIGNSPAVFTLKEMNSTELPNIITEKAAPIPENISCPDNNILKNSKNKHIKRAKTPEEKLFKRINREINRFKYIGDINIDDREYTILIDYIKYLLSDFSRLKNCHDDILLATALVQIGIREYNGRFWPHVSRIAECKLDGNKQGIIGGIFYETLVAHNKFHLDKSEIVNNILMHCFVTKYYADDFFEFLFAYYQHDLDRDLSQHTKEMRNYLLTCMKKAEDSSRAFRIKKGTADAATANELGCKIRVRNILKWMDAYLFEDTLPEKSQNRTARFFCAWAKSSKRFHIEKKSVTGYGTKGKIHFRTPYIHFERKSEEFYLVLPVQTVPLNDDENSASLTWKITYNGIEKLIESETESTVIGCKNLNKEYLNIAAADIFMEFRIELVKNDDTIIKRFVIHSDCARFFDDEFDYFAGERLYEGLVYAFTQRNQDLQSDSSIIREPYLGLDFYSMKLAKGNVVKKPDGKALFVGKDIEEGLSVHNRLEEGFVLNEGKKLPVYRKAPSLLLKITENKLNGTLLIINGKRYRLNSKQCMVFNSEINRTNYCLIYLDEYVELDGIYEVLVNLPSERHTREYSFALSNGLDIKFIGDPYLFKTCGEISLAKGGEQPDASFENQQAFPIDANSNNLNVQVGELQISLPIPMLKWKFDISDDWHIEKAEELWHKELPDYIYFQTPIRNVVICNNQTEIDDDEPQEIKCSYNSEENCYLCDTRRIKSWLECGKAIHSICVKLCDKRYEFLSIVTHSILRTCLLETDDECSQLVIKSDIIGFFDCVVDVYRNGGKIADKVTLSSNGTRCYSNVLHGQFDLIFYEYDDDDEFDFGDAVYSEFARKSFTLKEKNNLINKTVRVDYLTEEKQDNSLFSPTKYLLKHYLIINISRRDEENRNIYYGVSQSSDPKLSHLDIQIELLDRKNFSKALIFFYDSEEETYVDFMYDEYKRELSTIECDCFARNDSKIRYLEMTPDAYYHITILK